MVIYNVLFILLTLAWVICSIGNMYYTCQLGKTVRQIHRKIVQDTKSGKHVQKKQEPELVKWDKNWGEH